MSIEHLGQHIAREQDQLRARTQDRVAVRAELEALQPASRSKRPQRVAMLATAAAVLAAAAVVVSWLGPARDVHGPAAPSVLAARLEGSERSVTAGAFVEAPAGEKLGLRFSDGTRLQMGAGARARLVALDAKGAHLLLESGQAHVEVVPRSTTRYRISAGPFVVRVTGTRFDVRWHPEQDQFELDLERGHVEVSGCVFGQGYAMRAGQRVHASCKRGQFDVTESGRGLGTSASASASASTSTSTSTSDVATVPSAEGSALAVRGRTARDGEGRPRGTGWQGLVKQGKYAQALAQGDFEQRCEQAGGEQLVLLADAARYAGEPDKEGYALRLLRQRFAGTPRGALAAFALGRLEFDVYGGHRKAAEWFGTYLKEQPSGPLVREARGRLIEATFKAGDGRRARALAHAYLREYPDGPHADLARSVVEAPPR